jgi:hypothetical protein
MIVIMITIGKVRIISQRITPSSAMTTARRIAQEMGVELGTTVGYHVRYDKCTSSSTAIKVALFGGDGELSDCTGKCSDVSWLTYLQRKVVTDGILLREMQSDFMLTKYRHTRLAATDM